MPARTPVHDDRLDRAITNALVDVLEQARLRGELDAALDVAAQLDDRGVRSAGPCPHAEHGPDGKEWTP